MPPIKLGVAAPAVVRRIRNSSVNRRAITTRSTTLEIERPAPPCTSAEASHVPDARVTLASQILHRADERSTHRNTAGDRKAARAARRRVGILGSTQEGRGASRPDKWPPRQRKTPPCVDCVERRGLLAAGYLLNTHVADFTVTWCQLALQPRSAPISCSRSFALEPIESRSRPGGTSESYLCRHSTRDSTPPNDVASWK